MSDVADRFSGLDLENSYLLNVIYDDRSLTLEMDFRLNPRHPAYEEPAADAEGCFRNGFIRFAQIDDLQLDKAKNAGEGEQDFSEIFEVTRLGGMFEMSCGWGVIKVTARSIQVGLD